MVFLLTDEFKQTIYEGLIYVYKEGKYDGCKM
jgi:hypothetical protein